MCTLLWNAAQSAFRHRFENVMRTSQAALTHLKGTNDVFDISYHPTGEPTAAAAASGADQGATVAPQQHDQQCDLSKAECRFLLHPFATNRCVAIVPCGHVVSYSCALPQQAALQPCETLDVGVE